MDTLLQPQSGLIIWTVVTFLALVFLLSKLAWKPILKGLNARESKIKSDLDRAEKAHQEAQAMRSQFESQLAQAQKTIQDMIAQARVDAERSRSQLIDSAKVEAERVLEKGRKELTHETEKLKLELQHEVSSISLAIAEKILHRSIDPKTQEEVLKDSLKSLMGVKQ